jgi:hypothetical protein
MESIVTITEDEREAALQQWLSDYRAGRFKKEQPNDVTKVAVALGVDPPPLPLSSEGQRNVELISEQPLRGKVGPLALTSTRRILLAQLEWSQGDAWPERTGPTDKLTYEAVVRTAVAANELTVGMSRYTLAELTGLSSSTAYRSTKRHVARGRFTSKPSEQEELGTRYTVVQTVVQSDTRHGHLPSFLTAVSSLTMHQSPPDLFRSRAGLSKAALRLYDALDPTQGQRVADLAAKLNRHRTSIEPRSTGQGLTLGWPRT